MPTGFTLRPTARVVRNGGQVDLSQSIWDAAGNLKPGLTPAQQEEILRKRYAGAIDREGLHVNAASECLIWALKNQPGHPDWNRPAGFIPDDKPTSRERTDAWMTDQGERLFSNCPHWNARGDAAGLVVSPESLEIPIVDRKGTATLSISAGVNRRWAIESSGRPPVLRDGQRTSEATLTITPNRGAGSTTLNVEAQTQKEGTYSSTIIVSGGASLKIPVPVKIKAGATAPTPSPEPSPEPPPAPTNQRLIITVSQTKDDEATITVKIGR